MSARPSASPRARDSLLAATTLAVALSLSGLNGVSTSFDTAAAMAKLAIGLLHLAAIGWGISRLLELERPRHLAIASHMLLGQVAALGYCYLRSALCSAVGVPGISIPEVTLVEGALLWFAWKRDPRLSLSLSRIANTWGAARRLPELTVLLIWLSWLAVLGFQKLDLLYTPSSDPDIHAFYTKVLIERGHLYYDLLPFSDAWMVYPSGFSCLNLVLGLLSGLHPVQLVNIGPYLQFTLFCGAAFAVMSESIRRPGFLVFLGLLHFGVAYICFNAVLVPSREMLEGTPRLAHSALLFFPLFFALQHSQALGRRPSLLVLPLCGVVTGICINPAHAPAALLFGASSIAVLFANREARLAIKELGAGRLIRTAAMLAALGVVFLATDPFYQSLFLQQSAAPGQVEEARDLTGGALTIDFDTPNLVPAMQQVVSRTRSSLLANPGGTGAPRRAQILLLILLLGCIAIALLARRDRGRGLSAGASRSLVLAGAGFACLLIHGLWSGVVGVVAKPEVLQGSLLLRYTESFQHQISALFFGICVTALFVALTEESLPEDEKHRSQPRAGTLLARIGVAVALLTLIPAGWEHTKAYYPKLRATSLGRVYASDLAFIARAREQIGDEERVLLPGRLAQTKNEEWIFATDAGRAVPLFSDIRTSFFLGLDGGSFTAGAYRAHVQPPNFDPVWLHAKQVVWLIESGNFPARILARHYDRVAGNDHAVLWRLRPLDR